MDDARTFPTPTPLGAPPTVRRGIVRLVGLGWLLLVVGGERQAVQARRRRRRRRRGKRHARPDAPILSGPPAARGCDPVAGSGIDGLVLLGPMCPVVQRDAPCPDQPFVAALVVRTPEGTALCTTSSGADGRFRVGLPPGAYVLDPTNGTGGTLPFASPQPVTVEPERYTAVTIVFDSGIR